ncbi:MAG TPA: hypothetical protein V6D28_02075 [Leptolyngbyaceae cyanobacterium]
MPPIILIILLVTGGLLFTDVLVTIPLETIRNFNLPGWMSLFAIALLLFWCFGE